MPLPPNLKLIGTSHVARESVEEITAAFQEFEPNILAVELDEMRIRSLFDQQKRQRAHPGNILRVGLGGYLFSVVGSWVQRRIGGAVGMDPGAEMRHAIQVASSKSMPVALIDQRIDITLQRFSARLSWRERGRMIVDIFNGLLFGKREMEKLGLTEVDFTKVPGKELVKKLLGVVKERYPNLYWVLVVERNKVMAHRLKVILEREPEKRILAVVGAGHIEGMTAILERYHEEKMQSPEPTGPDGSEKKKS